MYFGVITPPVSSLLEVCLGTPPQVTLLFPSGSLCFADDSNAICAPFVYMFALFLFFSLSSATAILAPSGVKNRIDEGGNAHAALFSILGFVRGGFAE